MKPAVEQPKDGDRVVLCRHVGTDIDGHHVWKLPELLMFSRPDGTKVASEWFVCCNLCYPEVAKDGEAMLTMIENDAKWIGDEPLMVHALD